MRVMHMKADRVLINMRGDLREVVSAGPPPVRTLASNKGDFMVSVPGEGSSIAADQPARVAAGSPQFRQSSVNLLLPVPPLPSPPLPLSTPLPPGWSDPRPFQRTVGDAAALSSVTGERAGAGRGRAMGAARETEMDESGFSGEGGGGYEQWEIHCSQWH